MVRGERSVVRPAAPTDRETIAALAANAEVAPLRYLRLFGHDIAAQEQRDRVLRQLDEGVHSVLELDGEVAGYVGARHVEDLTSHFGVRFHEIGPVLTGPGAQPRRSHVGALLGDLPAKLTDGDPAVMVLRLEADDLDGLLGAEDAGFRIRETTLTFVNDLERRHRNVPVDLGGAVRLHRFGVDPPLGEDFIESVRGEASQAALDHYHADPRLPDERCDALYERVLERGLHGVGADVLVMRLHEEQLVGMGTWRHWSELEPYGVSMAGSSFGFRIGGAPAGMLAEVTSFVCNESLTGNRLLEWSTQAANLPMVNMIARPASIRLCRTSHVLHRWTDGLWG